MPPNEILGIAVKSAHAQRQAEEGGNLRMLQAFSGAGPGGKSDAGYAAQPISPAIFLSGQKILSSSAVPCGEDAVMGTCRIRLFTSRPQGVVPAALRASREILPLSGAPLGGFPYYLMNRSGESPAPFFRNRGIHSSGASAETVTPPSNSLPVRASIQVQPPGR